jgi:glycosyltransferase involved in cell wall biosynthesis
MTNAPRRSVLLTVSGTIPSDLEAEIAAGRRPRVDYVEMARAFDADLLDYVAAESEAGRTGRLIRRAFGRNAALAWRVFQLRHQYEVIVTDGEQVGLPYAALAGVLPRRGAAAHVMIAHILSVPKKVALYRTLRLGRRIDEMIVYASAQGQFIVERLRFPADRVTLSTFMVDTRFFSTDDVAPSTRAPMICSAGLEFRDYPTMLEAVRGLDADVVLAAASPWSKRASELDGVEVPANVRIVRLDLFQLRQLYADASIVVMPLRETDFQAGVTTLLEAMAMARPIVCTRTTGQTDVIVDGETGRYVPVGDAVALRATMRELLADPEQRRRLGDAARDWVVRSADIEEYVRSLAMRVDAHRRSRAY